MSETTTTPPAPVQPPLPAPVATQSATPIVDSLRSPQFVIANEIMLLVAGATIAVFLRGESALINTVVSLIFGGGFGGVVGFYLASSVSSQRKDAIAATPPPPGTTTTTVTAATGGTTP